MKDNRGPAANPGDRDLVEREGVNAGSGAALSDDSRARDGDVLGGGSSQRADEQESVESPGGLLGPPRQEPGTPGQELSVGEG